MSTLMVQGVSSDAGKSVIVTALCRLLARRGVRCAPFKAQNMSNNARPVDGGEIGVAQWLQARAADVEPDVRMNPVLLKPESDTRSQVVVNGVVDHGLGTSPWRGRSERLWPVVTGALDSLRRDFDVVIIEGAGSPAETNLWADDIVNMRVADYAGAPVMLVADIDRGGSFAHLYGTWALLPEAWRDLIRGFVLNKFRGDPDLLGSAPGELHRRTGVPVVGVLPWISHHLPDEEGPTLVPSGVGPRVGVVCGPYASNLDEFARLQQVANVHWVADDRGLDGFDLVILPGSKHVAADLAWLHGTGLAHRIRAAVRRGAAVLGICGGLQMLGRRIDDPGGVESPATGLGLLELDTSFAADKSTGPRTLSMPELPSPWAWLSDAEVSGYEIRHGASRARPGTAALVDGLAYLHDNVLGVYTHGLFEDDMVLRRFCGREPESLEVTFDVLADALETHLVPGWVDRQLQLGP